MLPYRTHDFCLGVHKFHPLWKSVVHLKNLAITMLVKYAKMLVMSFFHIGYILRESKYDMHTSKRYVLPGAVEADIEFAQTPPLYEIFGRCR